MDQNDQNDIDFNTLYPSQDEYFLNLVVNNEGDRLFEYVKENYISGDEFKLAIRLAIDQYAFRELDILLDRAWKRKFVLYAFDYAVSVQNLEMIGYLIRKYNMILLVEEIQDLYNSIGEDPFLALILDFHMHYASLYSDEQMMEALNAIGVPRPLTELEFLFQNNGF